MAELVARLRTFNAAPALHALVKAQGPLDRVPIPLLLAIAAQYSYLNEQERALALLDEARRGDPEFPPTLLARAQVLMYLGRFDEAQVDARAAREARAGNRAGLVVARRACRSRRRRRTSSPRSARSCSAPGGARWKPRSWPKACTRRSTISATSKARGPRWS